MPAGGCGAAWRNSTAAHRPRSCTLPDHSQYLRPAPAVDGVRPSIVSCCLCDAYAHSKERDVKWFGGRSTGSAIPTPQALLRSVYVGRMCVAVALYLAAALKFAVAAPLDLLVTSFVLVATVIVTIASYWHTHIRARVLGQTFLYAQALFDVALITTVVHITGGPQRDRKSTRLNSSHSQISYAVFCL